MQQQQPRASIKQLRSWKFWLPVLMVVAVLLAPLPSQYRATWVNRLLDLGHLPLFALLTISLWYASQRRVRIAFLLAVAIAGVMEICQLTFGRSASLFDFTTGVLGCLLAVVGLRAAQGPHTRARTAAHVALAMCLVAAPLAVALPVMLDAFRAYRSFPVLCEFATPLELHRWHGGDVEIGYVTETPSGSRSAARMRFAACPDGYCGAVLFPVIGDWSGYRRLCIDFAVEGEPIRISLSIRDGIKIDQLERRFRLDQTYQAGEHHVCIDLEALRAGEEFAPVDISRVQSFHIVMTGLEQPRTLFVYRVYLD